MGRLDDVARRLYAVPPSEFIAARKAAAADASDAGDAATIRGFRKPSVGASTVNALARADPELIDELLGVGSGLRAAQEKRDGDGIREFARRRQAALATARARLAELDPSVSASTAREVEETLQAAIIDDAAAAAVKSGFLVRALESTGLDQVDVADAVALPVEIGARPAPGTTPSGRGSTKGRAAPDEPTESAAEKRARERRHAAAVARAEKAAAALAALVAEQDAGGRERADLEAERDRLDEELRATDARITQARFRERELRARRAELEREARAARRDLD